MEMPRAMMSSKAQIPKGWRLAQLGEVCDNPSYGASARAQPFDPNLPRYVRITDIDDDGRLNGNDLRSAEPSQVLGYELCLGDILFARSGSVGRTFLYRSEDGPCVYAGYLIRFRPLPEKLLPRYLNHWTHCSSYWGWIGSVARRGAQTNINATEYSTLPILLPPLPQQRAIVAVLDSIDDAIERTESVITATEQLRNSLLHQLLTRGVPDWHTEWKEVPGLGTIPADWGVVKLGDVIARFDYGTSARCSSEPLGIPVLRIPNIASGELDLSDLKYADLGCNESAKLQLSKGDILLVRTNGNPDICGRCWVTDGLEGQWAFASYIVRGRPDQSQAKPEFVGHFLSSAYGRRLLRGHIRTSAGNYNLSVGNLGYVPMSGPSLREQCAIVDTVASVDETLEQAKTERAGLQSLKESTADALLTGRVRVG